MQSAETADAKGTKASGKRQPRTYSLPPAGQQEFAAAVSRFVGAIVHYPYVSDLEARLAVSIAQGIEHKVGFVGITGTRFDQLGCSRLNGRAALAELVRKGCILRFPSNLFRNLHTIDWALWAPPKRERARKAKKSEMTEKRS